MTSAFVVTMERAGLKARQSLFTRDRPPRVTFYLHEFVLRLPVGGPAVMLDQVEHLLRMSRRPFLTRRVVPAALGAHAAMAGRSG